MKSKIKIAILGLMTIVIIETSILAAVMATISVGDNSDIKNMDIGQEKDQFFGKWKVIDSNETYWFKPDGSVEINETASRFGMGVYTEGYTIWNGTWDIKEVSETGEESQYVLVISNLTEIYSSTAGYADGMIEEGDSLKIIYEFREKLHGDALYLYLDVFSPIRLDRMK